MTKAAPAEDITQFMATNLAYCQALAARITAPQCQVNRTKNLYVCGKCTAPITSTPSTPSTTSKKEKKMTQHTSPDGARRGRPPKLKIEATLPPPAAAVPPEESLATEPAAELEQAAHVWEPYPEVQTPAPAPRPEPAAKDHIPVPVDFEERDLELLAKLEKSALYHRRTIAAEILFRLDRTFDEAV